MSPEGTVRAEHVWKRFRPDRQPLLLRAKLRDVGGQLHRRRTPWTWALRDVSFDVPPGSSLGLIGSNGSGKSTLLKILTRVMYPYAGQVEAVGRIGALIEVASGIHPELTGRENVFLYGSLLGLSRKEVAERFDDIVSFAEVTSAIDRQTKFYSSGMKMRLGFAVAAFLEPAVLLVDEVLAVGDATFQQRCLDRMRDVIGQGTTLIYVSHDLPTVEAVCTRAIWLRDGVTVTDGPVRDTLSEYRRSIEAQVEEYAHRGHGIVRLLRTSVEGPDGGRPRTLEPLAVRLVVEAAEAVEVDLSIGISDGPATPSILVRHAATLPRGTSEISCRLRDIPLPGGRMFVWAGANRPDGHEVMEWAPAASVEIVGPELSAAPQGIVRVAPIYTESDWKVE